MTEGEGDDALLEKRGELVGHARLPALPRAQDPEAVALDHPLPAVEGRTVDAERATRLRHADPTGEVDEL
jgi:hypothetical protein